MKPIRVMLASLATIILALAPFTAVQAGTQDFTIPSFETTYTLSRDTQHIAHLSVLENIEADFPNIDQNHGILRALPQTYEGHSLSLHVDYVLDSAGKPWHYTTSTQNSNLILKIGDAGTYVHGRQSYVISYSMANVTTKPDTTRDGLFWDVNGDQWAQVFDRVAANITVTRDIAADLLPAGTRCFTGTRGSTTSDCTVTDDPYNAQANHDLHFTTTRPLGAGETLTYELSFKPGTFAAYTIPQGELASLIAGIVFLGILPPLLALIFMIVRWRRFGRDPEGHGTIIAEYLPPKDLSALSSSVLLHESFQPKAISAQIIDLAVRHYLKIYEVKVQKLLGHKTSYEIELVQAPGKLRAEEKLVLELLLGADPAVGMRVNLDTLANKLYAGATSIGNLVATQLSTTGYFRTTPSKAKLPYTIVGIILIGMGCFSIPYLLGVSLAGIIVLAIGQLMPARTALGVEQREYLLGLKLYMQMAEADRLKVLQSPHGKLTEKVDINDTTQLIKLYEKLLPYAMLFGIEKDWAKEFAALYTESPSWYSGSSAFSAGYFAGSIANFGAVSTASFTPPSSSGSGGSAGGGGGGGGGGGW